MTGLVVRTHSLRASYATYGQKILKCRSKYDVRTSFVFAAFRTHWRFSPEQFNNFENFCKTLQENREGRWIGGLSNDPLPNTIESYIFKPKAQERFPPRRAAFPTSTARSSCRICACTTSGPRRCSPRTGRQSYRLTCPLTKLDAHRLERCNRMPLMWISAAK